MSVHLIIRYTSYGCEQNEAYNLRREGVGTPEKELQAISGKLSADSNSLVVVNETETERSASTKFEAPEEAKNSLETLKCLYTTRCTGEDVDPPKWWTFHYTCPKKSFLPKDYSALANITKPNNGVFVPRMEIEGIHWYGQMLDFIVSEMFFLHPAPVQHGRFIEIGAYTGLEFTNTLFFEHYLDWNGWLFEPTTCFDICKQNRPKARVFQQGLCAANKEMEFGTFGTTCKPRVSPCLPLTDMEEDWSLGFEFVSIDVEGNEMDILKSIDFAKVPVKVLVIEWRPINKDSRAEYLSQFGYVRLDNFDLFKKIPLVTDEIYYRPDLIQPHIFQS